MRAAEHEKTSEPRIYGMKIYQPEPGCYSFTFHHEGDFRLGDYEELDFDVRTVKLVRR